MYHNGISIKYLGTCGIAIRLEIENEKDHLTLIFLVFWWLDEAFELHIDMDFDTQEQSHFQQHQLQLTNTCRKQYQSTSS